MKKILSIAALLFCFLVSAQKDFKKGYYIENSGQKRAGFINSSNFRLINDDSFTFIEFKERLDQDARKIDKNTITELGSEKEVKLQKIKAPIDDVSFYKDYSNEKGFTIEEKSVFLNVLVEGGATLYSYDGGHGIKYLWKKTNQEEIPKQFLYKKYYNSNKALSENQAFREQLFNNVKCPNQEFTDFLKVKYEKEELIAIFKKYNNCINSPFVVYENDDQEKIAVNISVLAGYSLGNFRVKNIQNPTIPENFNIFSAGIESEVIFASRKASLFASIELKNEKASTERTAGTSQFSTTLLRQVYEYDAFFIDVILGGRLYKKISSKATLFGGGGVGLNAGSGLIYFSQANTIDNELKQLSTFSIAGSGFLTLHLGCQFDKHWGVDVNYDSPKNVINNSTEVVALVNEVGVNLRYKF